MVDEINIGLFAARRTSEPAVLQSVLTALDSKPLFAPTHANVDERKRLPYERTAAVEKIAKTSERKLILWRTSAPKYAGWLNCEPVPVTSLKLNYSEPRQSVVPELFEQATHLAHELAVEYGFVHLHWERGPESMQYDRGRRMSVRDLTKFGLSGAHARTWFGPYLVSRIGKAVLLQLPFTSETPWGGIQLDLVPQPWLSDLETLSARSAEVKAKLGETGLLGVFEGAPVTWRPGPNWTSPGWADRS